jgi:hypothetical protein
MATCGFTRPRSFTELIENQIEQKETKRNEGLVWIFLYFVVFC